MNKQNKEPELIRVCRDCGRETDASAKFCPFCGEVFIDSTGKGVNPDEKDMKKPKQTSTWPMILVGCILLILLICLVLFIPWRMPFPLFSK